MGRTTTPTYRVEYGSVYANGRPVRHTAAGWNVQREGRPTDQSLAAHVESVEASTAPGGVNEHLGVTSIGSARVVRQATGDVVAEYRAPLFKVVAS